MFALIWKWTSSHVAPLLASAALASLIIIIIKDNGRLSSELKIAETELSSMRSKNLEDLSTISDLSTRLAIKDEADRILSQQSEQNRLELVRGMSDIRRRVYEISTKSDDDCVIGPDTSAELLNAWELAVTRAGIREGYKGIGNEIEETSREALRTPSSPFTTSSNCLSTTSLVTWSTEILESWSLSYRRVEEWKEFHSKKP